MFFCRYAKWAEFAQNPKVTAVKNSHAYLCALHFARNQFRDDDQDKLIYRAIPTIPAGSDGPVFSMYQSTHTSVEAAEYTECMYIHSSEEDEDLVPHVQILYPHDNPLEQSPESCALDSCVSTSLEACEEGIVDQRYNSDDFLRSKKYFNEASSVSNAHNVCGENGELNLLGHMSHKMATPGRKRQINHLLAKRLSPRVFRNNFGVQRKNMNNLLGLNSGSDSLVQQLEKMVPIVTAQFLASRLLQSRKQGRRRKWTATEKVLSAVVCKRWPECHRLLVKMLMLPGRKTLLKMMAKVFLQPGLNYNVFQPIAEAVVDMDAVDRTCLLLFGEVPVREYLEYDNKSDAIAGFQNLGDNGESPKVGNRALVFMVKGLGKQWKQPVAFYFTRGTLESETSVKLMCSVLQACKKAGLNVVGTVCRAGSGNAQLLKLVGASESRPYFHFEKQKIVTLYDVPHLLRYLRNILLKNDILVNHNLFGEMVESKASWSFVRAAYDIDVEQSEQRRLPKLTDCHIAPKDHVTAGTVVAAQVLSRTMATTIFDQATNGEYRSCMYWNVCFY
ncbi:hypothetical protein PR048_027073 [Dryococelus australis]|uniref:Transposable element P transposase-like RNase H domain-containing protein n=1 Tax=Dryococelus australis TaxID=614101 RepID=A0ABQ9GEE4_9NEOP|nr:hypothetical protein PR048_027073 [Dryococelus australis]